MAIKLKICGVKYIQDVMSLNELDIDFIGMINDPISPRYVDLESISRAQKLSKVPIVTVKINGDIKDFYRIPTDYIQIHRILKDEELEMLKTIENKKFILYVPASLDYLNYLKKAEEYADMILFDSPNKTQTQINVIKKLLEYYPMAGIAGGINSDNISDYAKLRPGFIDISRGVEDDIGKKNINKVKYILKVIKN